MFHTNRSICVCNIYIHIRKHGDDNGREVAVEMLHANIVSNNEIGSLDLRTSNRSSHFYYTSAGSSTCLQYVGTVSRKL